MKELRQAMDEFLREFAERAQKNPNLADQMQPGQELRQSDIDRLMDQIENLAKSGNREQAQELLSQLENMMNNLQAGRQQQRGQNGQQGEMRKQMDKLGEIMRRQQEMMNETFRMDQMQRGQRQRGQDRGEQQGEQGGDSGEQGRARAGGMTPEEFAEALKQLQEGQGKLRGDLEALMKGLEGMGIQPGEGFGEAGDAMGEAETALGEGQGDEAVGQQGRALEALRKGAQDMMQQMQQAMQGDEGGGEEGGRQQNADRDPLGRPRATIGPRRRQFGEGARRDRRAARPPDPRSDPQAARQLAQPADRTRLSGAAAGAEIGRRHAPRARWPTRLFVSCSSAQHFGVGARPADELHAHRPAAAIEADRHVDRRAAGHGGEAPSPPSSDGSCPSFARRFPPANGFRQRMQTPARDGSASRS